MSDQFLGEIRIFAGNFAPTGWAFCNGQLLLITQNTALFALDPDLLTVRAATRPLTFPSMPPTICARRGL